MGLATTDASFCCMDRWYWYKCLNAGKKKQKNRNAAGKKTDEMNGVVCCAVQSKPVPRSLFDLFPLVEIEWKW